MWQVPRNSGASVCNPRQPRRVDHFRRTQFPWEAFPITVSEEFLRAVRRRDATWGFLLNRMQRNFSCRALPRKRGRAEAGCVGRTSPCSIARLVQRGAEANQTHTQESTRKSASSSFGADGFRAIPFQRQTGRKIDHIKQYEIPTFFLFMLGFMPAFLLSLLFGFIIWWLLGGYWKQASKSPTMAPTSLYENRPNDELLGEKGIIAGFPASAKSASHKHPFT